MNTLESVDPLGRHHLLPRLCRGGEQDTMFVFTRSSGRARGAKKGGVKKGMKGVSHYRTSSNRAETRFYAALSDLRRS
jgi:hypothetical protein